MAAIANDENLVSFAVPPPTPAAATTASTKSATARFSEGVVWRLGALLNRAIEDATSIEVKTYTSAAGGDATDPSAGGARLRAFSRVSFDGDTETCVPLKEGGGVDSELWEIHKATVEQARADRARAIDAAIAAVQKFAKAVR